jgi:glutathione S-transferase
MITLYHRPKTRSSRFIFLLEELGAPYEIKPVTLASADGSSAADPANPHPHGKVPAISDDGVVVYESSAITLYLTDKFPANGIGPMVGDPQRGPYLTWLAYYAGVLEPAFISKFTSQPVPRPMAGWVTAEEAMALVNKALAAGPYLLGEKFSGADVLYGTTFAMFGQSPLMPKSDAVDAYVKRVIARPAYARAMAKDG